MCPCLFGLSYHSAKGSSDSPHVHALRKMMTASFFLKWSPLHGTKKEWSSWLQHYALLMTADMPPPNKINVLPCENTCSTLIISWKVHKSCMFHQLGLITLMWEASKSLLSLSDCSPLEPFAYLSPDDDTAQHHTSLIIHEIFPPHASLDDALCREWLSGCAFWALWWSQDVKN